MRHCLLVGITTPILVGILPLASVRNAEFLTREVPGMQVPKPIIDRLRRAGQGPAPRTEGVRIAQEAPRLRFPTFCIPR